MNAKLMAECIFWLVLAAIVLAIYQAAILPDLRLGLRYRMFALRDRLRELVIKGTVKESDKAFILLHDQLNFASCNLFRYDMLRVAKNAHEMTELQRTYVAERMKVIEEASEEIREIYHESLDLFIRAVVFNSLPFFVFISICFGFVLLWKNGFGRVKEAYRRKIEQDSRAAFIYPEFAAVAV